jgi:transcriptional regulator with XRE-family HTH domain
VDLVALGQKLATLRERRGMSASSLAEKIGISRGYLSRLENGWQVPSIVVLDAIGQFFEVGLDYFFITNSNGRVAVQRAVADLAGPIPDGATFAYEALCMERRHKLARPFIAVFRPRTRTKVAVHEAEYFRYVIEGSITLHCDGQSHAVGQGDTIYYDASLAHELECTSASPSKVLTIFTKPSGFGAAPVQSAFLEGHL